jgi:hypothetical protein
VGYVTPLRQWLVVGEESERRRGSEQAEKEMMFACLSLVFTHDYD